MPVLSFLLYVFITSFTPGPNNLMAMLSANKYGFKGTLKFCLGVGAGFFVIILCSSYFNLMLKNFIPKIQFFMSIFGAVYMLYLAYKILRSNQKGESEGERNKNGFISGMILQFINPKGILYGITVVGTFILPFYHSVLSFILFAVFLGFVGFVSTMCWSTFGSLFQRFLNKYRMAFNVVMSLLLLYSAVSIFIH
ncbi:LysE family transporter [Niallia sp. NCCP-28]|uniref:LysE family transporter n=1 Tax=Niallia sp. NCCP-28 TaxID=2934712 RepID=UPI0020826874|nr:LysE family transporter [Niallia sp. NCCP-28]GKU81970.1 amino acid transporter LysE [Niallia sp. NCCP-28]